MPFHDVFLSCLFCLLFILLCSEGDIRLFVSGLWRSVPLEGWRRGGCHLAGLLLAMLALAGMGLAPSVGGGHAAHPAAAACLGAVALILLGGGAAFSPFWGIPALVLYGLLPSGVGCYGLMAVCLWAAGRAGTGRTMRFVALVLLLGLGHGMAVASPLGWILGAVLLSGLCLLGGGLFGGGNFGEVRGGRLSLLRYCPLLRPLLLLGVMELSRQQGLTAGVQASFFALLLDLACQGFGVFWPCGRLLALAIPPLPGFVIGWVGLHAALGLGSSTEGWTVVGGLLAVLVMALSLGEGLVILGEGSSLHGASRKTWALGLFFACVLPSICGVLAGWLCGHGGQWSRWLYLLPGGDGSVLALPLFWLALLVLWAVLGRAVPGRMAGRDDEDASLMQEDVFSPDGEERNGLESLRLYLNATPTRPRMLRLLAVQGHRQMRSLRLVSMEVFSLLPVREPGMVFWLVFLGGVLVVLGLGQ